MYVTVQNTQNKTNRVGLQLDRHGRAAILGFNQSKKTRTHTTHPSKLMQ